MIESQIFKAVLWMLGAMFSLFLVGVIGKVLSSDYDTFEIMFYRSVIAFPLLCLFIWITTRFKGFNIENYRLHLMRNFSHFTAQNLWFFALATLPLAVVVTFEFTTPSWVIIIAAIAFGEGFGWRRAIVIVLSLIGIIMITDPRQVELDWPILAAIACAIGFAITMILTKKLTKTQNVLEILFMMTLLQAIFASIIVLGRWELAPPLINQSPFLILIAIFGTTSHYCMTKALSLAEASTVSPVDLLRLPLSVGAGWILFGEAMTWLMGLGTILLIAANYINIRRKS